jgi:hypothetical protein
MVGGGVLNECLQDPRVESVVTIGRSATGRTHPKLREIVQSDLFRYPGLEPNFREAHACFFCLGVSAAGLREPDYTRLTYDLTLAAATAMATVNPGLTFCYVSGAGTDSSERGRIMWARVKGRTENALLALPFKAAFMFRPGFIQPIDGVRSKTGWYRALYAVTGPIFPLLRKLFPGMTTTTRNLGRAMIEVALSGHRSRIVNSPDINELAAR